LPSIFFFLATDTLAGGERNNDEPFGSACLSLDSCAGAAIKAGHYATSQPSLRALAA
jgi:hypothetical protein